MPKKSDEEPRITDKDITDWICSKHGFFCDIQDQNTTLYIWDGGVWHNGVAEGVILHELSEIFKDEEEHLMALERTTNFIKGQAMNLKLNPKPPHLISFRNGLLDIETGELKPHDSTLFVVNQIPWDYAPEARCPKWTKWLSEVLRTEDLLFFQEWTGYNLYSAVPEAAFVVLIGTGQNGKSIYMIVLSKMVGDRNLTNVSLANLTYDTFAPAELYHKLANVSDDIGSTTITNAGKLKEVSSGSMISAQRKFGHPFGFRPYVKQTFACNEPPELKDSSEALKFRLKAVEFPFVFTKEPEDGQLQARDRKELEREFEGEMSGIINWALEGLKRLVNNNFNFSISKSTEDTWKFYQRKSNPAVCFVEECLEFTDSDTDWMTKEELWRGFKEWIILSGLKMKWTRDRFFRKVKEQELEAVRSREHDMQRIYVGVRFVPTFQDKRKPNIPNTVPTFQQSTLPPVHRINDSIIVDDGTGSHNRKNNGTLEPFVGG